MRTLFDPACRASILDRLDHLEPDASARWGRMTAPKVVAHLGDQMRMTLGPADWTPMPHNLGYLRYPLFKHAALYVLPWPRERIMGPPEAFVTPAADWDADMTTVKALIASFVARGHTGTWPAHSHFGPLNGRQWGMFCYRHFDHHLRQFGV